MIPVGMSESPPHTHKFSTPRSGTRCDRRALTTLQGCQWRASSSSCGPPVSRHLRDVSGNGSGLCMSSADLKKQTRNLTKVAFIRATGTRAAPPVDQVLF